jgi:hypothetical protein
VGEYPPYGPPIPAKVISMIGPDRELFLQGYRSETQGFGIGAFAYYRRVVENQKSRIIQEVRRVADRLGADKETLSLFDRAMAENQFSKAIDMIRNSIPSVLLLPGVIIR